MIRVLAIFVLCAACKMPITHLPIGTRVPMDELYQQRADVAAFVQRELDAKHDARAFYALELDKTRLYSEEALAARDKSSPARLATTDLREVYKIAAVRVAVAEPGIDAEKQRGLVLAKAGATAKQHRAVSDTAFWAHMRRFEKRTAPLNETTIGIPYDYAARHGYGVSTAEETGRLFASEEALLSFFVHGDTVSVFVVVRGALHVKRLDTRASTLREQVERFVRHVRTAPKPGSEQAWVAQAKTLYSLVLGPVEGLIGDKVTGLFISPHGFLANLPFGLLVDARGKIVLETRRVTFVPSASIYRQLLARPILNRPPRMLAVGNAIYPEGVERLDFAEKEATTVSEMFPDGILLRDKGATEARVKELAPTYNILHFATHGVLLGSIVPGGSSLLVTADDAHDGFLSAGEIAGLDLSRSYIAVLSACETAVSEENGRSIDLGNITNAFLTAGAPSVLGSMWQVDDAATTTLMLDFYQQFLEVGAGEALRRAQLAVRKDARFTHPYY
nr:CHAT domain-containing protein [Deltaproteobacteria bacterium]